MADSPYNRTPVYPLEKPLSVDINQGASQIDRSIRDVLLRLFAGTQGDLPRFGFLGTSLRVTPHSPADGSLRLAAGIGFQNNGSDTPAAINGVLGLDDL